MQNDCTLTTNWIVNNILSEMIRKRQPTVRVIEDADVEGCMHRHAVRLGVVHECSICFTEMMFLEEAQTYGRKEGVVLATPKLLQPVGCNHQICASCYKRWIESESARPLRASFRRLPCCAPPGECPGRMALPETLSRPIRNWSSHYDSTGTMIRLDCPRCRRRDALVSHELLEESGIAQCLSCLYKFCSRCESEARSEMGACSCQNLPDQNVPSAWSRHFMHADGWPMRRREITFTNVEDSVRELPTVESGAPVSCPTCGLLLHKSSECNELTHCAGGCRVCYWCGAQSFPWETHGLPTDHWKTCPRYDWDALCKDTGFGCTQGLCYSDHAECHVAEHQSGIAAMHRERARRRHVALLCGL